MTFQVNQPWRESFVFFPKTDCWTGARISGVVMKRSVRGVAQYRAMTDEEQAERTMGEAW